ncbi:MAG: hypothetical protein OXS29_15820 [bacterium]|nr:hypothetical protein [bacterium]MDE0289464.1 hypothetical protein [bacterium]MDE0437057.1 hypothetical protein [bacterium]
MDDLTCSRVAELLRQSGLDGPAFDVAAVADGLAAARVDGRELERLLDNRDVEYATTFEPEWR